MLAQYIDQWSYMSKHIVIFVNPLLSSWKISFLPSGHQTLSCQRQHPSTKTSRNITRNIVHRNCALLKWRHYNENKVMSRITICQQKTNFLGSNAYREYQQENIIPQSACLEYCFLLSNAFHNDKKENGFMTNDDKLTEIMCCSKERKCRSRTIYSKVKIIK